MAQVTLCLEHKRLDFVLRLLHLFHFGNAVSPTLFVDRCLHRLHLLDELLYLRVVLVAFLVVGVEL